MRRRLLVALIASALGALLLAPVALAGAGGGSSAFHGGGGGGHGKGAALYLLFQLLIRVALFAHGLGLVIILGIVLLAVGYAYAAPRARAAYAEHAGQGRAARRRTAKRARRTELAAAEAAEEDPAFAPDVVKPAAAALFTEIQHAWDRRDRAALSRLLSPGLLSIWERRLDDFERRGWHNRVEPLEPPRVEYVSLSNQGRPQVTVRIEATLRDYVEDAGGRRIKRFGRISETVSTREFWTLVKGGSGRWILAAVEQGAEGVHALDEQLVPTPWSDDQALRDDALTEQAVADALPATVSPAELVSVDLAGDARAQALDLSLADGRFAPDILEIAARRAVNAWARAVDGDERDLRAIATRGAIEDLLHPSPSTRLVVRGPEVKSIAVTGLDAAAKPPTMTIAVELEGRRYVEDRNTAAVISGSQHRSMGFTETWTLTLDGSAAQPWRVAEVQSPLARA